MNQAIQLPKSSASIMYEQLGYLESFDAIVDKLYAMLIYKETKTDSGKWVIRIKGSVVAGSVFDPDNRSLADAIRKAKAHGKEYLVWGFNLTPRDNDPRMVENRIFCNEDSEPERIEVHLVTRDTNNNALPEKIVHIDWPGAEDSKEKGPSDFESFYTQYEKACRVKDIAFLKSILPPDISEDEFSFVLEMSQQSALAIDASEVKPVFSQKGNKMDVTYNGDLGDGMTNLVIDFYLHDGRWLKFNQDENRKV